jgi:hypothetical protein
MRNHRFCWVFAMRNHRATIGKSVVARQSATKRNRDETTVQPRATVEAVAGLGTKRNHLARI